MKTIVRQFWVRSAIPCAVLLLALLGSAVAQTHNVTFENRCLQQVWLAELAPSASADVVPTSWALAPRCSAGPGAPKICAKACDGATDTCKCTSDADCKFGAPAGTATATCSAGHCASSTDLSIPAGWSGRFWPRTKCSGGSSDFTCKTGQCGDPGNIDCTTENKSANRATLFEITTGGTDGLDNYDVSLVSGYNLPIRVIPLLPTDAPIWKKDTSFANQATITQTINTNNFLFNNIGSGGTSGNTKPKFPATRFATVADGPSITWNNNGLSCETAGCTSDLRATCPWTLQVKSGTSTIACDSPANVCLNGGPESCSTNAMYYACKNYAGAQDLFGNVLGLQSPGGESPLCFSAKDCQPGTTCLMNPTFVKALNPPLPTGVGVCTPVIQNGACTPGNEGTSCAAFPYVDYTCNTIQLSPTSTTAVCLPPTTSGAGELVWNSKVWSATATTCTAGGGECSGAQQCLDSGIVGNGQKECSASSGSCFCYNPDPCLAGRGTNDGCSQPDSCLNSDGVPDGGSDNGTTVDCSSTTCYCGPQATYSGTCGPTNADWLTAAKYPGVGGKNRAGFEKYFKLACPTAYAYQYDDPSSDWTCNNTNDKLVNYRVIFCPAL